MFGEPMDSILTVVGGVWLLCSVGAVTILLWLDIFKVRPVGFRQAVDTAAVWTNRMVVVVALLLLVAHTLGVAYDRWGVWVLVVAGVWLGLLLVAGGVWLFGSLVALVVKLWHKQKRDTDSTDRLDADPGVEAYDLSQPPEPSDSTSDSSQTDDNLREVAEIILFESRERRKGQEYRLEHYQKLSIQVFGWTLVFWSIFVSQRDLPTSSSWFCVAAVAGVLSLAATAYTVMPSSWTEAPRIQTMTTHYYDEEGRPRRELERSLMTNLEESFHKNESRLDKMVFAVRAESAASLVSVIALVTAVTL